MGMNNLLAKYSYYLQADEISLLKKINQPTTPLDLFSIMNQLTRMDALLIVVSLILNDRTTNFARWDEYLWSFLAVLVWINEEELLLVLIWWPNCGSSSATKIGEIRAFLLRRGLKSLTDVFTSNVATSKAANGCWSLETGITK